MTQPAYNPVRTFSNLGMPLEPPLISRNHGNILRGLEVLGQAPGSVDLVLDDATIAVYDRLAETAGEIGDTVGRSFVSYGREGLVLPERTEYGSLAKPGLELEEDGGVTPRLLGYLAFKKLGNEAVFSGHVLIVEPKEVQLEALCLLKPSAGESLRHEMWQFAARLGLGSLWTHFETTQVQYKIQINDTVGQYMGKTIADSLKSLHMSAQT